MTTGHVFIAASLDGFIARSDGSIDWLETANAAGEDHGYDAFVSTIDGLFMGRETFKTTLTLDPWPHSKPIIVLSKILESSEIPGSLSERVRIVRSIHEAFEEAERQGWKRAYVDGGRTIQGFLREGKIEDIILTRVPILLGSGRPLFGGVEADVLLRHLETRSFPSGLVQSRYEVIR